MTNALVTTRSNLLNDSIQFTWWFVSVLVVTIYFKYSYLSYLYHEGLFTVIRNSFEPKSAADWLSTSVLLFGKDVFEVFVMISALYLIVHRLFKVNLTLSIIGTAIILGVIGISNLLSFQHVQSFITVQNLQISISWLRADPTLLNRYFTIENALLSVGVAAWVAATLLLLRMIALMDSLMVKQSPFISAAFGLSLFVLTASGFFLLYHFPYNPMWWLVFGAGLVLSVLLPPVLVRHLEIYPLLEKARRIALPVLLIAVSITTLTYFAVSSQHFTKQKVMGAGHWTAIVGSLIKAPSTNPLELDVPDISELLSQYDSIAFPAGRTVNRQSLVQIPHVKRIPRHILIVSLETALMQYYPIVNNPEFVNFYEMSKHSIVSELHHSNIPYTTMSAYSILTGVYALRIDHIKYGDLQTDSLPAVLKDYGYDSTYIDTFLIDWRPHHRHKQLYESLGFDLLIDESDTPDIRVRWAYADKLEREVNAFREASGKIIEAQNEGRKAMIFLQTQLGHYSWPAKPGHEKDMASERIVSIAQDLDKLFGQLLMVLNENHLLDQVIIVVTGDHGLRYSDEFLRLGHEMSHSDLAFNVPLLIYSPGLLDRSVSLPYVTSHVDIAPTVLALIGVPTEGLMHHGMNVLDTSIAGRVTFLMNTGLSPVDGFHWGGYFFTHNTLTRSMQVATKKDRSDAMPIEEAQLEIPRDLLDVGGVIENASEIFEKSNAYFLQKK